MITLLLKTENGIVESEDWLPVCYGQMVQKGDCCRPKNGKDYFDSNDKTPCSIAVEIGKVVAPKDSKLYYHHHPRMKILVCATFKDGSNEVFEVEKPHGVHPESKRFVESALGQICTKSDKLVVLLQIGLTNIIYNIR